MHLLIDWLIDFNLEAFEEIETNWDPLAPRNGQLLANVIGNPKNSPFSRPEPPLSEVKMMTELSNIPLAFRAATTAPTESSKADTVAREISM